MSPIFVVIVNYRTARLAVDCLESLAAMSADLGGGRVIVADNDSGDDSVAVIRTAIRQRGWAGGQELLPLPRNGGFAYGNNAAVLRVRAIAPDFGAVLLLNPDTVVRPGAIHQLGEHLEANPNVGIVGALIENESGRPESSAHSLPSPLGELEGSARLGLLSRLINLGLLPSCAVFAATYSSRHPSPSSAAICSLMQPLAIASEHDSSRQAH